MCYTEHQVGNDMARRISPEQQDVESGIPVIPESENDAINPDLRARRVKEALEKALRRHRESLEKLAAADSQIPIPGKE